MRKLSLLVICSLLAYASLAQEQGKKANAKRDLKEEKRQERRERINALIRKEEEGALIYEKQSAFGARANTNGYDFTFEKGWMKSVTKTNFFQLEFGEIKHPKENKTPSNLGFFTSVGNPFVYGKRNIFYHLKIGGGQQRLIGGKSNKNGVAVHALYGGGVSVGLLRPYYLRVEDQSMGNEIVTIKYSAQDSSLFLGPTRKEGTGLSKGWKEIKFNPGIYTKTGIRFDYGRYNELLSAVEVGVTAEFYPKKPEIMLVAENKKFYFSGYIAILFGKRK